MRKAKAKSRSGKRKAGKSKKGSLKAFFQLTLLALIILSIVELKAYLPELFPGSKTFSTINEIGKPVDQLNGVYVFYNGHTGNSSGRSVSPCGYNIGQKYQCVEFVKRYYFEYLGHKMPNSYGHAKDFFNPAVPHGTLNKDRNLIQYSNNGKTLPKPDDLLIFGPTRWNKFGHVAIVSRVDKHELEYIQQNPGLLGNSRETIKISHVRQTPLLEHRNLLGWLRKE
jgi:hypothetical protein